jgi:hypothetical protein
MNKKLFPLTLSFFYSDKITHKSARLPSSEVVESRTRPLCWDRQGGSQSMESNIRPSEYTWETLEITPVVFKSIIIQSFNPVYVRHVDSSTLTFSLSSHPNHGVSGHRVAWLPRVWGGPSAFGTGPSYHTWALGKYPATDKISSTFGRFLPCGVLLTTEIVSR